MKVNIQNIIKREEVGKGPHGETIFHVTAELKDGTFMHSLGCPLLEETRRIAGQIERDIPKQRLEEDVSFFQKILADKARVKCSV